MRFGAMLVAVVAALGMQVTPAKAVVGLSDVVELKISALVDVTRTRFACDGVPANCGPIYEPYKFAWDHIIFFESSVFDLGSTSFDVGYYYGSGNYTGTITYLGEGLFSGTNLQYGVDGGMKNCINGPLCYAYYDVGNAPLFKVTALSGAVPEPAAWAMMLLGFGAIGVAMRRRASLRVSA